MQPKTGLILRRTDFGDGPKADDYSVLDEQRQEIGRIYFASNIAPGHPAWLWSSYRSADKGWTWNLEEAKAAFKAAWERG